MLSDHLLRISKQLPALVIVQWCRNHHIIELHDELDKSLRAKLLGDKLDVLQDVLEFALVDFLYGFLVLIFIFLVFKLCSFYL